VAITVRQEPSSSLADYASIPIAFEVRRVLDAVRASDDPTRFTLVERAVERYTKDYDAGDGGPAEWPDRFDVARWAFFIARDGGQPVGAAACVFDAPDVDMLDGQPDVALLWDIRVAPDARGRGVGRALLAECERWSIQRGARWLEVETQNVNAPACRFYEGSGFELRSVGPNAYPALPHETQLLWYKRLAPCHSEPGARAAGR
jgi:ribosomal protein S18 acetylase RimI-like enzyme